MNIKIAMVLTAASLALSACAGTSSSPSQITPASQLTSKHDASSCPELSGQFDNLKTDSTDDDDDDDGSPSSKSLDLKKTSQGQWTLKMNGDDAEYLIDGQNHSFTSNGETVSYAGFCSHKTLMMIDIIQGKTLKVTYSYDKDGNLVEMVQLPEGSTLNKYKKHSDK